MYGIYLFLSGLCCEMLILLFVKYCVVGFYESVLRKVCFCVLYFILFWW